AVGATHARARLDPRQDDLPERDERVDGGLVVGPSARREPDPAARAGKASERAPRAAAVTRRDHARRLEAGKDLVARGEQRPHLLPLEHALPRPPAVPGAHDAVATRVEDVAA